MENSNNTLVPVESFIVTKNPNYFVVTFKDTEVEVGDELHVTQFNTTLILKSNKERYEKLIAKGTTIKMMTTHRD